METKNEQQMTINYLTLLIQQIKWSFEAPVGDLSELTLWFAMTLVFVELAADLPVAGGFPEPWPSTMGCTQWF